jgi:hypothetical protein
LAFGGSAAVQRPLTDASKISAKAQDKHRALRTETEKRFTIETSAGLLAAVTYGVSEGET